MFLINMRIEKFMLNKHKIFISCLFLYFILRGSNFYAQSVLSVKVLKKDSLERVHFDSIHNKTIPDKFAIQIKTALQYYPTLRNTRIVFKVKKAIAPLAAAPTVLSVFGRKSKRTYVITISSGSIPFLNKIILDSLNFNAQVGVLGHEISHILEYENHNGLFFVGLVLRHLSTRAMDKFEYNTDKRCIEQGLGYQLLAWSQDVRRKLNVESFNRENSTKTKTSERYMHPQTIERFIREKDSLKTEQMRNKYGENKIIPKEIESECLAALSHFPELKDTKIEFIYGAIKYTMQSQPKWDFFLKKKSNRTYVIRINNNAKNTGMDYNELSFNAKIGWIGHELSHICDYKQMSAAQIIHFGAGYTSSSSFKTKVERRVDNITIQHGLGGELYEGVDYFLNQSSANKVYKNGQVKHYLCLREIQLTANFFE